MPHFSAIWTIGRCLLLLAGLAQYSVAFGQDAADTRDRDCPAAPPIPVAAAPGEPCISLDASRSVDPLAGPLTFRWQMGDGQVREGLKFNYCYAAPGRYLIQLDVLDSLTGEVRQHELEREVDFKAAGAVLHEPALRITAPDKARIGEPVTFDVAESELPPCLPSAVRFDWNFRDGLLAQGRHATHTFRRAGTFVVRLALDGSGLGPDCLPRLCVTRAIVIEP